MDGIDAAGMALFGRPAPARTRPGSASRRRDGGDGKPQSETDGVGPVRIGGGAIAGTGLASATADRRRAVLARGQGVACGWKSPAGCTGTPVDTGGAIASETACRRCVVQVRRRGDPVAGAGPELRNETRPGIRPPWTRSRACRCRPWIRACLRRRRTPRRGIRPPSASSRIFRSSNPSQSARP